MLFIVDMVAVGLSTSNIYIVLFKRQRTLDNLLLIYCLFISLDKIKNIFAYYLNNITLQNKVFVKFYRRQR